MPTGSTKLDQKDLLEGLYIDKKGSKGKLLKFWSRLESAWKEYMEILYDSVAHTSTYAVR